MKSTGVVRKIDELGRVVIPIELRRNLNLNEKDSVEIFIDEDKIILQKYKPNLEKESIIKDLEQIAEDAKDPITFNSIKRAIEFFK